MFLFLFLLAAPKMMHAAMSKMPLLVGLDEDTPKTEVKHKKPLTVRPKLYIICSFYLFINY